MGIRQRLSRRHAIVAASAVIVLSAAATAYALWAPGTTTRVAGFTEGGVRVDISVRDTPIRDALLVVLTPVDEGFHLYSVDLPDGGVDGLGIPTRLSVTHGLQASGSVSARPASTKLDIPSLGVTLPVYPDGPVTLDLPVRIVGPDAEIRISYGACSRATCLPPVRDHVVEVELPRHVAG